jgi:hypothetical protein
MDFFYMDDLLEDLKLWAKSYKDEIPDDAIVCGNHNQSGQLNSHYGIKHSEETKRLIGSKSKNRNWAPAELTAHYGSDNGKAKKVEVQINGEVKHYECLKDFYNEHKQIPYSSLKWMAQKGKSSRGVSVKYV